jgi:glycosyltransferase involved in cell wall biosynthesis
MAGMKGRALRILISSNIWEGRYRQWLGRATHRWYLRPLYDCVFVPGDRSEWFVRRLGFRADQVIRGSNSADVEVFDRGPRGGDELAATRRFLFSGRLMKYKGVDVLRDAYLRYRESVADPWDLDVVGVGELDHRLRDLPGVTMHGFVSPERLSGLMHSSACLVLPSYIDFFGVVVHEAATAGQVLLCSDSVGATPYLLQDGFNGWTVATGNVRSLADAMARVSTLPAQRLEAMSAGSRALAGRFSPSLWAENVSSEVERRLRELGRTPTTTAASREPDHAPAG